MIHRQTQIAIVASECLLWENGPLPPVLYAMHAYLAGGGARANDALCVCSRHRREHQGSIFLVMAPQEDLLGQMRLFLIIVTTMIFPFGVPSTN